MTIDPFADEAIPRDRWGRPLIIPPGGGDPVPYLRISTLAGALDNGKGLAIYQQRHVARGVGLRPDLAAKAASCEYGNKGLDEVIEEALIVSGATARANYGTAVHNYTDPGARDDIPHDDMRSDVKAYQALRERLGVNVLAHDTFVVCDELQVAGTFDELWQRGDFTPLLVDKKTGSLHFTQHAIQLAMYARGKIYVDGERFDLGASWDYGVVAHIPAGTGTATAHLVDISERGGWGAAKLARAAYDWNKRTDLAEEM